MNRPEAARDVPPAERLGAAIHMLCRGAAFGGGAVLIAIMALTVVSVVLREVTGRPIPGDYELVEMGCAIAIFAFLPYCQIIGGNVLVELRGGGLVKSQAYYSNSLAVQVIQAYGQVRVTDTGTGKPLPKIYVKVYARTRNGQVQFYKDGYTDLRGRFAYARLNTNDLENVTKFSLLVLSDAQGAVVKEAAPPKE